MKEGSFTGKPERWGFWDICMKLSKRASLSIGALLGNLEGVRLPGLLRKKKSIFGFLSWTRRSAHSDVHIWVPSFWTQRILGNKIQGPSGTLLKEQGSFNLVRNMGHKGPVLRLRCIGPGRAWTHILFYSSSVLTWRVQGQERTFILQYGTWLERNGMS